MMAEGQYGRCTFGTRPPVDTNRLQSIIYREIKHFRVYNTYTPDFGSNPVSTKFYAAHDQISSIQPKERDKIGQYTQSVLLARELGPHAKYSDPATENMTYGWYTVPLYPMDRGDRRFFHLRRETDFVKTEALIRMQNPKKTSKH